MTTFGGNAMKILVLGAGKVGTTIIEALSQENHEIKVIDKKQDVLDSLANRLDVLCLQGDGYSVFDACRCRSGGNRCFNRGDFPG